MGRHRHAGQRGEGAGIGLLGEDVVGKAGWVSCNSNSEISFRMTCAAGDLVLGYLESYDARMGVVNVTATSLRTQRTVHRNIDSKKTADARRSIFALSAIPGLSAKITVKFFQMAPRRVLMPLLAKASPTLHKR